MNKDNLNKALTLRHELHRYPALSLAETPTKERLMAFLREHTSLELTDMGRWFYALYRAPGAEESVAFRADMDALPMDEDGAWLPYASCVEGVSHRCGHDGHSAALALLALEVSEKGADKNVYFIFQHAEEIGAGGEECAALLREKGVGRAYAFHNWSGFPEGAAVLIHGVAQCASMGYLLRFRGKAAHAGSSGEGANPSEAIAKLILALNGITAAEYKGKVWNTVVGFGAGAENFGIAAAEGYAAMTLRAVYEEDLTAMKERVRGCAEALCAEYGLGLEVSEQDVFPATVNDEGELARCRAAAEALGIPVAERTEPLLPSEDFGWYQKVCPGVMLYMGNGEDYAPIHTDGYDFNDKLLETVSSLFEALI